MKKLLFLLSTLLIVLLLLYPESTNSFSTGSPGGKTGSPADNVDCMECHVVLSTSSALTSITSNIPSSGYVPGTIYTITASLNPISTLNGFEITCEEDNTNLKSGTFFITNSNATQLLNNGTAVTHTAGGNNLTTWSFDWEAPISGTGSVTFYGAFIEAGYPIGANYSDYFSSYTLSINEVQYGCTDSTAINFNPLATIDDSSCIYSSLCQVEIDGDSIFCILGNSQILVASPTALSNSFDSYLWSTGSTDSSITITMPGNYCVTATDSNGCISNACINVDIQDIPISTFPYPPIICNGDSIVLEIDTNYLSNITWVPNTLNTPPFHRVVDFPTLSTNYVVEAIDTSGCHRRGEVFVTVDSCNNFPCIVDILNGTLDVELCDGDTFLLEATIGFDSYIWANTSNQNPIGSNSFLEVTDPGTYIVIATNIIDSCVAIDSIEVIVYSEIPLNLITLPDPPIICLGDSIVIEVDQGFVNYWWNTGNPNDLNQDRVVVYPTVDFTYTLEALDTNGCQSREEIEVYIDTCVTFVEQINHNKIEIYPNPASDMFYINLNSLDFYNLEIVDAFGKLIIKEDNFSDIVSIKSNKFLSGTYFIKLKSFSDIQIHKLIIDK